MNRRTKAAAAVSSVMAVMALAGGAVLAITGTAQAALPFPTTTVPVTPRPVWEFEGFTSTDLQTCNAQGSELHAALPETNQRWNCEFGNPTPNVYNLWLYYLQPGQI
jgi:hypothetical protein